MEEINYWYALGYALIGWVVQITIYYFKFDTDATFIWRNFWNIYDKYIILGFVGSIALALLGDFAWPSLNEYLTVNLKYDERVNIITGCISTLIILFFSRNAHKKLDG